jgi:RimJ/RimL family protein N-acetyltransferase
MTETIQSLADEEIVLRDLTTDDRTAVAEFFGADRVNDGFVSSGMHIDAAGFDLDQLVTLAAAQPGDVKLWIATTTKAEPLALQVFHRTGFPGVWTYSVVTGTRVAECHGIGTRIITLGIDRLFADPAVHRLAGYISVRAPAPWRIAERLGFVLEGRARQHIAMPDGTWADAHIVSLLRDEWLGRRCGDAR